MKPINQTRFTIAEPGQQLSAAPGDCFAACLASILELPLAKVPDEAEFWHPGYTDRQSWRPYIKYVHRWLMSEFGLLLLEIAAKSLIYSGPLDCFSELYTILSGPSPRNPKVHHAVVGKGGIVAHDPHPSRAGLIGDPIQEWWHELLVPIAANRLKQEVLF